jgi:hypothetical protein
MAAAWVSGCTTEPPAATADSRARVSPGPRQATPAPELPQEARGANPHEPIRWRRSRSLGLPSDGRLVNGVQLPFRGRHFFTWQLATYP